MFQTATAPNQLVTEPQGRNRRHWVWRVLTGFVAVPVFYIFAAFLAAFVSGPVALLPAGETVTRIGLARGQIHYDFLLPLTPEIRAKFDFARAEGLPVDHPMAKYLIVGWGSKTYIGAGDGALDRAVAIGAQVALGDQSVMHLDLAGEVTPDITGMTWIDVSAPQLAALTDQVLQGFTKDNADQPVLVAAKGYGATDRFYESPMRFSALKTCNVWVGDTLRAAGISFGAWTPLPESVALSLWWFGA